MRTTASVSSSQKVSLDDLVHSDNSQRTFCLHKELVGFVEYTEMGDIDSARLKLADDDSSADQKQDAKSIQKKPNLEERAKRKLKSKEKIITSAVKIKTLKSIDLEAENEKSKHVNIESVNTPSARHTSKVSLQMMQQKTPFSSHSSFNTIKNLSPSKLKLDSQGLLKFKQPKHIMKAKRSSVDELILVDDSLANIDRSTGAELKMFLRTLPKTTTLSLVINTIQEPIEIDTLSSKLEDEQHLDENNKK